MRNALMWAVIILVLLVLFQQFNSGSGSSDEIPYTQFIEEIKAGNVAKVEIEGQDVSGTLTSGEEFSAVKPIFHENLYELLSANNVNYTEKKVDQSFLTTALISWLPFILLIGVWIFFMRQMQGKGGGGGAMGFGKSRARLLTEKQGRVTFEDVAGIEEAKEELEEIVDFLKDPQKFQKVGGQIPKGALLVGPPGTGKTLLARAIAGEANVPFFTISGSDFVEMFVGVGASRVRDMFEQAKKNAPCIIFIDEIDAVGRHRGAGVGGGNDEREQTLNQLLVEMDGFEANEGIIIVAATNRPDVLDPALLRPGRFDRQVVVPNPDITGREQILGVHIRKIPQLAPDVNVRTIARGTPGFSGADLMNLVNEAALLAARRGKKVVAMQEFEDAKDKVMMGSERRSMVMTDDEKKLTAYHEGGHALVSLHCKSSDPIHKATIIPRGRALGMVMRLPERDEYSQSREKMHDNLAIAMGGRVAEEIIFGYDKVTSGASSDIQYATNLARAMVTQWGMSDKLGPLLYASNEEEVFLGHSVARQQNVSGATAKIIDEEIRRFVDDANDRAKQILTDFNDDLHTLANALLEYETLSGDEIKALLAGEEIRKNDKSDTPPKPPAPASTVPTSGGANLGEPQPEA
ncbi:ATP-dependent zinc metalloprotease FtsH [Kordiimonas sp. SCSIO 12610]|uniref:ATP-dependent zinc metalloprotease FtsH n=1 Tax=Kordiimonas sp. SCSIO 12610 TaxID=2829597 RepID=UPI00210CEC35|nr:ATP-dependent zinc metalloprotease FtsH [Kordiimonas sp. SCSIO 12610]UTW56454.1 ATP-dependent zinc metalloprotease FtsH [Kordiimonas sp. SCSIO 12610]